MVIHVTFEQNEIYLLKQREVAEEWLTQILKDKCQSLRLHNWKNISSLNLYLERCWPLTSKLLFCLIKGFSQRLPHLRKLSLNLDWCEDIGNEELEAIGVAISKHMVCLKSLHLGFPKCDQINDQDIENFMLEAVKFRLEKLGLILSYCSKLTDETFQSIQIHLPKLINLQKLTLSFSGCNQLTENGSQQFLSSINSSLTNLKQLNLDFKRAGSSFTDNDIVVFANSMQEKSPNIQSLTLDGIGFSSKQDYSKGLEALGFRFRNSLANLLSLTIEFGWLKFSVQSFVEFARNIASLSRLKKIGLTFDYCSIFNDTCAENLIAAITENLTNLEELSLVFNSCGQITEQGVEQIGHHLGQNVNKLKSLKLDFSSVKLITDTGLEVFASKIGTGLHGLKSLALNFSFCDHITGKGLAALLLGLGDHLQNLEEFILDLMSLPLKDEDFNTWAPFFGKGMTKLKHLSLCLIYQDFSDKAVEFLAMGISENLSHLHELIFNIEECQNITDTAVDVLGSKIKDKCRNLFKLHLLLECRNKITIKGREKWREELNYIPNLMIF